MKKLIASLLCAVSVLPAAAFAVEDNGLISPAPVEEPQAGYILQIDEERTDTQVAMMVPLRAVAEKLGFAVQWNGDGTIFMDDKTMHTTITLGEDLYQVTTSIKDATGMSAPFSLGMPPCMIGGKTYVPLSLFDALLGCQEGAVTMDGSVIILHTNPLNK